MKEESSLKIFLTELFELYQTNNINYCLLRNYETLPDYMNSSDIDILVYRKDRKINKNIISNICNKHNFIIYYHYSDEQHDQFYLYQRIPGKFFLKIDFVFESELYGVKLIEGNEILKAKKPYKNFYIANDSYRFLDKWLYVYLLNARLPEKYHQEFRQIVLREMETISNVLNGIIGKEEGKNLLNTISKNGFNGLPRVNRIKRFIILLRCAVKDPLFHFWHIPRFFYCRLKYSFFPHGEFISVSGPDGSGKTTVLELALKDLKKAFQMGEKNLFHFRPSLFPRIAEIGRKTRVITSIDENYQNPHRAKTSNFIGSIFRLVYYSLDYILGYFTRVRPKLVRRELVIFDRYFYDMIADPERSRISLPFWLLKLFSYFIPSPKSSFFIYAEPKKIMERKQELTQEKIRMLNERYIKVTECNKNIFRINNNEEPQKAAEEIVETVIKRRAERIQLISASR
jgi:thymidylate kinase